jgi:hypothetical protein
MALREHVSCQIVSPFVTERYGLAIDGDESFCAPDTDVLWKSGSWTWSDYRYRGVSFCR